MLPGYPACDTKLRIDLLGLEYNQDVTRCATTGPYQDVRSEQSGGAKLLGQRNLTLPGWSVFPRERPSTASVKAVGGQGGWHG